MTISIQQAIENFKKANEGKEFSISFLEKQRNYPNGMYCHAVCVHWDRFFDRIAGNGLMWGSDKWIFCDDNGQQVISENFTNNTHFVKDFTSFNFSDKTVADILNDLKI